MIHCLTCGNTNLLYRLPTSIFVPVDITTGKPNFKRVYDKDIGLQARSNADRDGRVIYCPSCTNYWRLEELTRHDSELKKSNTSMLRNSDIISGRLESDVDDKIQ